MRIGLISDTHGLLRPEATAALAGSDFIVHAGDIGSPEVLEGLARIAPVTAIRGNVDRGDWAAGLPPTEVLDAGGTYLYVVHDIADLDLDPVAAGFQAVVSGHSHQPGVREKDGVLYINPGSAGPRRFSLPIAVGRLTISDGRIAPELVELPCGPAKARYG
ncbi:MAG TPA: metallophosphoesterase family protein [Alphaproteobacteria bacterium]|nr:metallophosphoesterase family protein [Alphaproteobacteria bacterium]